MSKRKSAIITGSTSGIGLAIAKALAGAGYDIMPNGFGDADTIEDERRQLDEVARADDGPLYRGHCLSWWPVRRADDFPANAEGRRWLC